MHFLETSRHRQVIYAPLRTGAHAANILGFLGLDGGTAEGDDRDRLGQPRIHRDQHPALKEDPRGGWLRDLTQEGIEPYPGPRTR
eukprot:9328260-Alexandrium_andersonii.AAC.1